MKRWLRTGLILVAVTLLAWACWDYGTLVVVERDLTRALTPVWTLPLGATSNIQHVSFEYSWPSDPQWQRIDERWDSPSYFLARFKAPRDREGEYTGLALEPITFRVLCEGVEIKPELHQGLTTYPEFVPGTAYFTSFPGFLFRVKPGSQVRIEVSLPEGQSPEGLLALGPYLRGGQVKDAMIAVFAGRLLAFAKLAVGIALIGLRLLFVYLDRRRGRPKSTSA